MNQGTRHPLAEDYLRRLRRAGRQLPSERLRDLVAEIDAHLAEAIPPGTSDRAALEVLERLGSPEEIVEAELPPAPPGATDRRGWREWAAVILLPLGGFALGIGWLIGLILLWTSRLWTTRDKLIGTLIVPGGIATTLFVVFETGTKRSCRQFTGPVHPPTSASTIVRCTPSGGPSTATTLFHIVLVAFFVLGPIVSAVYLARRARARSAFLGPALGH
jgi:hypothetical protein